MEVFDKDTQFLKDIWADLDKREVTKRVIAIALSTANPDITLGDVRKLDTELDDMLLEKESELHAKERNMTL